MRTPPLLDDFIHARGCKPICEKLLTLPFLVVITRIFARYTIVPYHWGMVKQKPAELRPRAFGVFYIVQNFSMHFYDCVFFCSFDWVSLRVNINIYL